MNRMNGGFGGAGDDDDDRPSKSNQNHFNNKFEKRRPKIKPGHAVKSGPPEHLYWEIFRSQLGLKKINHENIRHAKRRPNPYNETDSDLITESSEQSETLTDDSESETESNSELGAIEESPQEVEQSEANRVKILN